MFAAGIGPGDEVITTTMTFCCMINAIIHCGAASILADCVTKNVITGEGGMVITKDDRFAGRIKVLGLHGMSKDAWSRFSD